MTGKFPISNCSYIVLTIAYFSSLSAVDAFQVETSRPNPANVNRLALLNEVPQPENPKTHSAADPLPFSISKMTGDHVPPFAAHPELVPVESAAANEQVSFEENMPVEPNKLDSVDSVDSVDSICRDLSQMIAGNLTGDVSLESKRRMIETALKMVARNAALKSDAKITQLKADHALEIARMQSQMSHMRSAKSAMEQINRVAGPLAEMMQRNYQQASVMNLGNQQLTNALAQLGFKQLADEAKGVRDSRETIQLRSPDAVEQARQNRIAQLNGQISKLQQQLRSHNAMQRSSVQPASFQQPLRPRRQPLEPLPMYQRQGTSFENPYQQLPLPQYR